MATATEKAYVVARLEELEPAPLLAPDATDDGRRRFDVRQRFGITSFAPTRTGHRATTSSASTTRCCSARRGRRSSTSS